MKSSTEKAFLSIVMVMLVFSFPWLAFFPIMFRLAEKNKEQERQ